jgi:hypothetical protein
MKHTHAAIFLLLCVMGLTVHAADDPLPSWNDRPAKTAFLQFTQATTDRSNSKFVARDERTILGPVLTERFAPRMRDRQPC